MPPANFPSGDANNLHYPPSIAAQQAQMLAQGDAMLTFPVDFSKTDAAVLYTVPSGLRMQISRPFWEVITPFTGGAASAIGISSSNAAYNTKGDLLGGASGDVAAGLTAGFKGTIGPKVTAPNFVVLVGGDTIRFDRITSAFTAGAGFAHIHAQLVPAS